MTTHSISIRSVCLIMTVCVFGIGAFSAAQTPATPAAAGGNYRIAGTVVSKLDGHPLGRARITVRDTKDSQKFESLVTAEDGKFEFTAVPAGKYDLHGAKRGFIQASYDRHEQFSTAIVTGAGLDTEGLVLRLAPAAIIFGKVLDESGDPVRRATVSLYYDDHSSGVSQIRQFRSAQTDDQGAYEIPDLFPGTYFLSANAKPWYALHPNSNPPDASGNGKPAGAANADTSTFDRSIDVAYPLTYYSDVTDADSATPIPIGGGERLQIEVHLNPVPSLRLLFRVPDKGEKERIFPGIEQPAFDGSTFLQNDGVRMLSPGLFEVIGVPAGRYNVRLSGAVALQMKGVDLTKDGEEIDTSTAEALSTVKISLQAPGEATPLQRLTVGLRSTSRVFAVASLNSKGEGEVTNVAAGRYDLLAWGDGKPYSITHISAEGAEVSGHSLTLAAGSSPSVSLRVVGGSINVEGKAQRAGKPFAGAMVVLVPRDPEGNRGLFRRDQSDLDGTFNLPKVVPGSYTVLAIENGWDLDWSQPGVIAAYVKRGRTIEVGNHFGRAVKLPDAVEVQSK